MGAWGMSSQQRIYLNPNELFFVFEKESHLLEINIWVRQSSGDPIRSGFGSGFGPDFVTGRVRDPDFACWFWLIDPNVTLHLLCYWYSIILVDDEQQSENEVAFPREKRCITQFNWSQSERAHCSRIRNSVSCQEN